MFAQKNPKRQRQVGKEYQQDLPERFLLAYRKERLEQKRERQQPE